MNYAHEGKVYKHTIPPRTMLVPTGPTYYKAVFKPLANNKGVAETNRSKAQNLK